MNIRISEVKKIFKLILKGINIQDDTLNLNKLLNWISQLEDKVSYQLAKAKECNPVLFEEDEVFTNIAIDIENCSNDNQCDIKSYLSDQFGSSKSIDGIAKVYKDLLLKCNDKIPTDVLYEDKLMLTSLSSTAKANIERIYSYYNNQVENLLNSDVLSQLKEKYEVYNYK